MAKTCASLGFGTQQSTSPNITLILVDNGSNDRTLDVAEAIRANSQPESVLIAHEPERGYVPPRHRGNLIAAELARTQGSLRDFLILQADADTNYSEGYIDAMCAVAESASSNVLFKARTSYPDEFIRQHGDYIALCDKADANFEFLISDHPEDVIIDDKACGYRLSDYFRWGTHQREFLTDGDEVFAETTRLYLRAKTFAADAILVDDALAQHSMRRLFEHAGLDLATSGFPREESWRIRWSAALSEIKSISALMASTHTPILAEALTLRRRHVLGLFGILPWHVARSLGLTSRHDPETWAVDLSLPFRDAGCVQKNPGRLIEDVLDWIDDAPV